MERHYLLRLPSQEKEHLALVIALHGLGGDAQLMERITGFTPKAEKEGFAVCYPDGTGTLQHHILTWNAAFCCGRALSYGVDDVGFLSSLIDRLVAQKGMDPNRVYLAGLSNGGMMANYAASILGRKIAAIAPVAGAVGGRVKEGSSLFVMPDPVEPVPALIIHGRRDQLIPYDGGKRTAGPKSGPACFLSVADEVAYWAMASGIEGGPEESRSIPGVTVTRYPDRKGGNDVELWTVEEGGHSWPGSPFKAKGMDTPSTAFSATDAIWDFFSRHSRKGR